MVTSRVPVKCSKNFINCRKHPARNNIDPTVRFKNDFKAEYIARKESYYKGQEELAPVEGDSAAKNNKRKKQLRELESAFIVSKPAASFNSVNEWADGKKITAREKGMLNTARQGLSDDLKTNIEKEDYYARNKTLNDFQQAMAELIVDEGRFSSKTPSWGDTRGSVDYGAREHFEKCGVYSIDEYEENATWSTYDSFNSEDEVGVYAVMSCKCGDRYKSEVYLESRDVGSLMSRLLTR